MACTPQFSVPEDQAFKELFQDSSEAIAISPAASANFVKRFLAISVSCVAYLRAVVPEKEFKDLYMGDLHLKMISGAKTSPVSKGLIERMESCFDAIEKRYLRTVHLWFHEDLSKTDDVLESYIFKFSYNSDQANVSLSRNDKLITRLRSGGDIKESTVSFLKTLLPTVEKLEPLPSGVYLEFQVSYVTGTPADYEPPKFRPAVKKPVLLNPSLRIGSVSSNHHAVTLKLWHEGCENPPMVSADDINSTFGTDLRLEADDVRCICGGGPDGQMIRCRCCDSWQHAICYGVFPEFAITSHVCVLCAADENVEGTCFDQSFLLLSRSTLKQKALFRRALLVVSDASVVTIPVLSRLLSIKEDDAQHVLDKMITMKLVQRGGGGEEESEHACNVLRPALRKYLVEALEKMRKLMETNTKACSLAKET